MHSVISQILNSPRAESHVGLEALNPAAAFHPWGSAVRFPARKAALTKPSVSALPREMPRSILDAVSDELALRSKHPERAPRRIRHRSTSPAMTSAEDTTQEVLDLVKEALTKQEGFKEDKKGVSVEKLCDILEDDPVLEEDDDFERVYAACDVLEMQGWLKVDRSDEEDDMLYFGSEKGQFIFQTKMDRPREGIAIGSQTGKKFAKDGIPADSVSDFDLVQLIRTKLFAQKGFLTTRTGVPLSKLCELIDEESVFKDDGFDRIYDALDALEEGGFIILDNTEEDDVIYLGEKVTNNDVFQSQGVSEAKADSEESSGVTGEQQVQALWQLGVAILKPEWEGVELDRSNPEHVELMRQAAAFDREKAKTYDYSAEAKAFDSVILRLKKLKKFGVDEQDKDKVEDLRKACRNLGSFLIGSPAPPLQMDRRLLGEWELVGTTSQELAERKGLTGMANAPLTKPGVIFYQFKESGEVITKEVLEFSGQPVLLNELRGEFFFSDDGKWMQEDYKEADLAGNKNSGQFLNSQAVTQHVCISSDGKLRVSLAPKGESYFVYKKLQEGEMDRFLMERSLPLYGGTIVKMTEEEAKDRKSVV